MNVFMLLLGLFLLVSPIVSTDSNANPCPDKTLDIIFVVDSSGSIGEDKYHCNFDFIGLFVNTLDSNKGINFGLIIFGTHPRLKSSLTSDHKAFLALLPNVEYQKSTTNTSAALDLAIAEFKKNGRQGASRALILVTDGKSDDPKATIASADAAKMQGITNYVVAVGVKPNESELGAVATKDSFVFTVNDYNLLASFSEQVSKKCCDAEPPSPPVLPCPGVKIEIFFVVDSSGSIGANRYRYALLYMKKMVAGFSKDVFFGFSIFGTHSYLKSPLTNDKEKFYKIVDATEYLHSTTNTDKGLKTAHEQLTKYGSPDAVKSVVLITDGKSDTPTQTIAEANSLKDDGIAVHVLAVAVDSKTSELDQIASNKSLVYPVSDYSNLLAYASVVAAQDCKGNPPPPPVKPCPAKVELNVFLVVDSSGSIGAENFRFNGVLCKKFLAALSGIFKAALLTFGTSVKLAIGLTSDKNALNQAADNLPYQGSTTQTDRAIDKAVALHEADTSKTCRCFITVITDGRSTQPDLTQKSAKAAKDKGCTIAVIGVGDKIDKTELNGIASGPNYVFQCDNYLKLIYLTGSITEAACNVQ